MTAFERIKEIEKFNEEVWGPDSHAYEPFQFLLHAFRTMREIGIHYCYLNNDSITGESEAFIEIEIDGIFEKRMAREMVKQ